MEQRSHTVFFSVLYAGLACAVMCLVTSGGLGVSYDSENYLVMAERFAQQRWGETFNPVWPPLYPLAVAAINVLGLAEPLGAARIISVLSYAVLVVAVFLLGLRLQGRLTAHLSAISVLSLASVIYVYCFCWSETLYTMFSVLFFLSLTCFSLKPPTTKRNRYLFAAAICAGLATVTRFIGFSLVVTGALSILLYGGDQPRSRRIKRALVFTVIACAPICMHYLASILSYGLAGKTQFPSNYTFWQLLSQLFSTVYGDLLSFDLNFWGYSFFLQWGFLAFWLKLAVLTAALALFVMFLKSLLLPLEEKTSFKPQAAILLYFAIYSVILLYVGSTVAIDPIGSRFTAPLYPLILLLAFSILSHLRTAVSRSRIKGVASAGMILCVMSFWGMQLSSTLSIYRGVSSGSFPAMEHPGNLNRRSLRFLRENAGSNDLIITNIPRKLSFIWPRQLDYLDIRREEWALVQKDLIYQASRRFIYVLLCTEDYSPLGLTLEDIKEADLKSNLFSWRKDFGNDVIFKTKYVIFQNPIEPDGGR